MRTKMGGLREEKLEGARMDMKVIQDADEITRVVLDGRFDIQGSQ
jgi:hypothetical protein